KMRVPNFYSLFSLLWFRSCSPQRSSRIHAGHLAVGKLQLPIHEYVFHARRKLRRIGIGDFVNDGCRIKDRDISKETFLEQPAVAQVLALGRKRRDLADPLLQRQQMK